jgi:hypothetical protein
VLNEQRRQIACAMLQCVYTYVHETMSCYKSSRGWKQWPNPASIFDLATGCVHCIKR